MSFLSTHEFNESWQPNHLTRLIFPCCFIICFYPKYVLIRLLKFFFIKCILYFPFVILYVIGIVNWIFEILKTSFVHHLVYPLANLFFFFVIVTLSPIENFGFKVLLPNSGYKFIHTLFSFSLRRASFGVIFIDEWIALLYRSASTSST